jgi:hypothetical protein
MERRIGCAVLAFSLAACSGTSNGSIPRVTTPSNVHATKGTSVLDNAEIDARRHKKKLRVKIRIHVPNHKKFSNRRVRRRMTVSENTMGVQVVAYASGDRSTPLGTITADVSPASVNCTAGSNDARTCNLQLMAPPGGTDFVVNTYDVVPNGAGNFPGGNQIGYGVATQTIVAGTTPTVNLTLNTVLSQMGLALTPSTIHTIIPATSTVSVYGMDADFDVIVGNGYIDANGNSLSIGLGQDNGLSNPLTGQQTLSLSTGSLSAPLPNGVALTYTGGYQGGGSTTVTLTASASGLSNATATLTAIDPIFSSIADTSLQPNDLYHGGMAFDNNGGVYYTTTHSFGGISYYSGTGASVTSNYAAPGANPIRGGITSLTGNIYGVGGSQAFNIATPQMNPTPLPLTTPAPIPNGSAMAYDTTNSALWYTSGSNLVEYPTIGGAPTIVPLGVTADAGLTLDSSDNVWFVDNVNFDVCKYSGALNCFALEGGSQPWDILSNSNGIFVTDHGSTPAILQLNTSGTIQQQITVPGGAIPWYMMADNAEPGIVWFDYLINGNQIGLARMDTNVIPPTFSMATDPSSPSGVQPGALGAASNGLVYMVFENTQTLVKVQR